MSNQKLLATTGGTISSLVNHDKINASEEIKASFNALKETFAESKNPKDFVALIEPYWPAVTEVLKAVKIFTNNKVDAVIDDIVATGNKLFHASEGTIAPDEKEIEAFMTNIYSIYNKVKKVLAIIEIFLPARIKAVMDEIISIFDLAESLIPAATATSATVTPAATVVKVPHEGEE